MPEPRLLVISPYDKSAIKAIEKAIQGSDLGINPSNDGTVIRLAFPQLTEERRKELVKVVKHRAEEGRVAVRNVRRQARQDLEALEKDGEISKDDLDRVEKDLEKHTHEVVAEIDTLLEPQGEGAPRGLNGASAGPWNESCGLFPQLGCRLLAARSSLVGLRFVTCVHPRGGCEGTWVACPTGATTTTGTRSGPRTGLLPPREGVRREGVRVRR